MAEKTALAVRDGTLQARLALMLYQEKHPGVRVNILEPNKNPQEIQGHAIFEIWSKEGYTQIYRNYIKDHEDELVDISDEAHLARIIDELKRQKESQSVH